MYNSFNIEKNSVLMINKNYINTFITKLYKKYFNIFEL